MDAIKEFFQDRETRILRLRVVKAIYSREVIREDWPQYSDAKRFTSPQQVYEMFKDLILETKEHFVALHIDGKNRIICLDRVAIGSLNQCVVHPREIMKAALLSSAAGIILIHNHPTGDPSPSAEDINITNRLKEVGGVIGIPILDHIIIGNGQYVSFTERGLL